MIIKMCKELMWEYVKENALRALTYEYSESGVKTTMIAIDFNDQIQIVKYVDGKLSFARMDDNLSFDDFVDITVSTLSNNKIKSRHYSYLAINY